jgi:hypothetical protein
MEPWIETLRTACDALGQKAVAKKIGYAAPTVSAVLSGKYTADTKAIQSAVEGALQGISVDCPVIGDLARQKCIEHQRAPRSFANPTAVQLYRACRGGCPHSLIKKE